MLTAEAFMNLSSLNALTAYQRCVIPTALAYRQGASSQQFGSTNSTMTICRSLIMPCSELFEAWSGQVAWVLLCTALLLWAPQVASAKAKPHQAPRPEPELKILDLKVSPNPYTISSGSLQFSALVQLPKELNGATLLEVSSFITSPSKNSLRFLTTRTPLEPHAASTDGAANLCPPDVGRVGPEENPVGSRTLSIRSASQVAGEWRERSQDIDGCLAETGNDRSALRRVNSHWSLVHLPQPLRLPFSLTDDH